MESKLIPDVIVGRLPLYLRTLEQFAADGKITTSSQEIGSRLNISAAQIRKDLSQFGEFGKQGTGYSIEFLIGKLRSILNIDHTWDLILVGAGDLGRAIVRYQGLPAWGFNVVMIFDNDPAKVGSRLGDFTVLDITSLEEKVRDSGVRIAMLTVPPASAQEVAGRLVKAGINAILNYTRTSLIVPTAVRVQSIDPVVHLQRMTYYLD